MLKLKIIDRYILKQFLSTYIFTILVLMIVISVIDYSEKVENFVKKTITTKEIFLDYYLNFILYYSNLLTPLIIFIATVFVTSRLSTRTEIVAMLSSGISFARILVPYLIGAFLVAGISFYVNGWIMPGANKTRVNFELAYINNPFFFDERNVHVRIDDNVFAYMQSYNNNNNTGYKFTIEKLERNNIVEKLYAEVIRWDSTEKIWRLEDYKIHRFNEDKEEIERGREMDTLIKIKPTDFENKHLLQETMTFEEIDRYVVSEKKKGNSNLGVFLVEKYQRYASPFAVILLTILGVVMSSEKSRKGTSFQIAMGFVLAFTFIFVVTISKSLGQKDSMNPLYAIWIPNLIFSIVTFVLYIKAPK
jgi:lipopolysaccharide export system permease protein